MLWIYWSELGVKGIPSIFVIDEAHGLQYKSLSKNEKTSIIGNFVIWICVDEKL